MAKRVAFAVMGVLIAVVVLIGDAGAGDRDIAELLYGKGEKAYRKKAYEDAAGYCQRALDEHSPYPEAAYKLGMSLEKLGNGKEALDAYLLAEKQFGELSSLTRKQTRTLSSVRKCISKLGAGYGELKKLDDEFVKRCVAFCRRYFNSQPAWAKTACESALAINPNHELAKGFREKLKSTAAPTSGGGLFTPYIVDDQLEGWDPGVKPPYSCSGGVITVAPTDLTGHVNLVKKRLAGEFEFRAKFRPLTWEGKFLSFALIFGHKPDGTAWSLGIDWNDEVVLVKWNDSKNERVKYKIISKIQVKRWYQLGIKVKDGKLTALLDGKAAFEYDGGSKDAFDGAFGVISQEVKAEIKEVEMRR